VVTCASCARRAFRGCTRPCAGLDGPRSPLLRHRRSCAASASRWSPDYSLSEIADECTGAASPLRSLTISMTASAASTTDRQCLTLAFGDGRRHDEIPASPPSARQREVAGSARPAQPQGNVSRRRGHTTEIRESRIGRIASREYYSALCGRARRRSSAGCYRPGGGNREKPGRRRAGLGTATSRRHAADLCLGAHRIRLELAARRAPGAALAVDSPLRACLLVAGFLRPVNRFCGNPPPELASNASYIQDDRQYLLGACRSSATTELRGTLTCSRPAGRQTLERVVIPSSGGAPVSLACCRHRRPPPLLTASQRAAHRGRQDTRGEPEPEADRPTDRPQCWLTAPIGRRGVQRRRGGPAAFQTSASRTVECGELPSSSKMNQDKTFPFSASAPW